MATEFGSVAASSYKGSLITHALLQTSGSVVAPLSCDSCPWRLKSLTRSCGHVTVAGVWVGDCFIYNNSAWRLNYCVGGEVTTMFHLDRPMYLLGYLASHSKVYLIDKVGCLQLSAYQMGLGYIYNPIISFKGSGRGCVHVYSAATQISAFQH